MVFRRRRSNKGMVIDSIKHETRYSSLLAAGGTVKSKLIAEAKNVPIDSPTEVKTGSLIKAIFFENNYNFESNITGTFDWAIYKLRTGQDIADADFDPAIPFTPTRSQKFLWGMEMPAGINNSSAVKRIGTLLIPKGKQRMAEGDRWYLVYRSTASAGQEDACGHFIYKEYR